MAQAVPTLKIGPNTAALAAITTLTHTNHTLLVCQHQLCPPMSLLATAFSPPATLVQALTSCSVPSGGVSAPAPALADSGGPSSGRLRSSLGGICSCCRPPRRAPPTATQLLHSSRQSRSFQPELSRCCSHTRRRWSTMLPALILVAGAM